MAIVHDLESNLRILDNCDICKLGVEETIKDNKLNGKAAKKFIDTIYHVERWHSAALKEYFGQLVLRGDLVGKDSTVN